MRHDATFAEVLDAHLGCTEVPPPPRVWTSRPLLPIYAAVFVEAVVGQVDAEDA